MFSQNYTPPSICFFSNIYTTTKRQYQFAGALPETQVPGQDWRELCNSGGASAGETAGLQDHHA